MAKISGDISSVKPGQILDLERIARRKVPPRQIINPELVRVGSIVARQLDRLVGVLIGRKGEVEHVVLGSKTRIYLPDLGRFRLGVSRLRKIRLVVFDPGDPTGLKRMPAQSRVESSASYPQSLLNLRVDDPVLAPVVPHDLLTDLEKLRLDCLVFCSVGLSGEAQGITIAHLGVPVSVRDEKTPVASRLVATGSSLTFHHYRSVFDISLDFEELVAELEKERSVSTDTSSQTQKERAILIGAYTERESTIKYAIEELGELAATAGLTVVDTVIQKRKEIDPKTIVGKGKIEEIALKALAADTDLLIFDRELTPSQLRNITKITELRVVDRSMLILDIFAQRAITHEGRLQVELAQHKYSLPRLTDQDTGLSRLTGGIGGRGPGETKLEISRRRTRDRIVALEKRMEKIASQRGLRRHRRQGRGVPVIAIVGYTNAGKSTLLNALTKGSVFVENKLFATLDTSTRRMRFPNEKEVVFVDTVGFIRELPKELVNAFKATLEEVGEADLLIHLVDGYNIEASRQIEVVNKTLKELGYSTKPTIVVLNKIDLMSRIELDSLKNNFPDALPISAASRLGLEGLVERVQLALSTVFQGSDPGGFLFTEYWPAGAEKNSKD